MMWGGIQREAACCPNHLQSSEGDRTKIIITHGRTGVPLKKHRLSKEGC